MLKEPKLKSPDSGWDFRSADTKTGTHCYHSYPAMMIPQIAARLISKYGINAHTLFDPYCGTGTSLVEASLKSMNAFGSDLNPLARLIAETKTLKINLRKLDAELRKFENFTFPMCGGYNRKKLTTPQFENIDFWFKEETKQLLTAVKKFIDDIEDKKVKKFFLVAFSETARESSLTRKGEFKLYRIPEKQRAGFNPDVFSIMHTKLLRNRKGLECYLDRVKNLKVQTKIYDFDSSVRIKNIEKDSIDIVVTSPPYGDSKTTVAYGQFSRLANQWLGVEQASKVDNHLMGGKAKEICQTGFPAIDSLIEKIAQINNQRAKEIYSFYADYIRSIENVATVVKPRGHVCYVVGNRRVKNLPLPTDQITRCAFERCGFRHINTFTRNIPNKRMPDKNSPSNKVGHKSETMTTEYIVVLQKH